MRVFLGITGASGAPYAARVLDGLTAAGADVGLCASAAGAEVIAWELYRERASALPFTGSSMTRKLKRLPVAAPRIPAAMYSLPFVSVNSLAALLSLLMVTARSLERITAP